MKVIFVSLLLFGLAWGAKKVTPKTPTQTPSAPRTNCECGKRNTGRIFGGTVTQKNEYTWMAALIEKDDTHFCGGSVITERHILTAAHCFFDSVTSRQVLFEKDVEIVVGGHDLSDEEEPNAQRFNVQEIKLHEKYNPCNEHNDIAIVITDKKIIYNTNVGPICMPIEPLKANLTGKAVKVTGWGFIDKDGSEERVEALRELDLEVVHHRYCEDKGASQICAYQKGKDVCKGDSGGALVWLHPTTQKFTQVGLVSYGLDTECGVVTGPGVYTDVTAYYCWIEQKIWPMKDEVHTCHEIV